MQDILEKMASGEFELTLNQKHNCGYVQSKKYGILVDEVLNEDIQNLIDQDYIFVSALPSENNGLIYYDLTDKGLAQGWSPYTTDVVWPSETASERSYVTV